MHGEDSDPREKGIPDQVAGLKLTRFCGINIGTNTRPLVKGSKAQRDWEYSQGCSHKKGRGGADKRNAFWVKVGLNQLILVVCSRPLESQWQPQLYQPWWTSSQSEACKSDWGPLPGLLPQIKEMRFVGEEAL